jgi:hypothetical protein
VIQDKATVRGTIATGDFHDNSMIPRIMTQSRGPIEGCIICPGAIMPYGTISGILYADKIVYRQERSVYENWFKEVSISFKDISLMTVPFLIKKDGDPSYLKIVWKCGSKL